MTPVDSAASGAALFDNLLEKCMRRILGGTLDSEVFKELQLPMKTNPEHPHVGIGLTSACDTAASAFLSSASCCNKLMEMAVIDSAAKGAEQYCFAKMRVMHGHCGAKKKMFCRFRVLKLADLRNK